jgi:D-alanine-D-alanine ligase
MNAEQEPPGVAVFFNASERLVKGEPQDLLAEQEVIACAQAVSDALQAAGYRVARVPICIDLEQALAPYPATDWVIFNLAEGLEGRLFEEARIAWALEAMGYHFTGSNGDAIAVSTHKARAKALLEAHGIATPAWWVFGHPDEVDWRMAESLPFPLIVKPVAEDASLGVGPDAVVSNVRGLRERVAYVVERYRQAALAEVFVVGRELNVALWGDGPEILPMAEIDFSAFTDPYRRIVSFAAKWVASSPEYRTMPVHCPAPLEPDLSVRLALTARQAWAAIGCRGYARLDVRVSAEGIPYVVEVNCNPDIAPDAGFYRAARAAGYSYQDMVVRMLQLAWRQPHAYDREGRGYRWFFHPAANGRHQRLQPNGGELRRRTLERVSG